MHDHHIATLRAQLDETMFAETLADGWAMPPKLEEAIKFALAKMALD